MQTYSCLLMNDKRCAHYIEAADSKNAAESFVDNVISGLQIGSVYFVHVASPILGGVDIWRVQCLCADVGARRFHTRQAIIS